jgi:ATP-binding cassette, subfamily B, bacterial
VFRHVQRQPIAFFTRAQTGSLVSRLNGDVIGAQQAITSTLSGLVSSIISLVTILVTMFYLSWQVSLVALAMISVFILPARFLGRHLQRLTRESMQLDAELGSIMTERFNVGGAMLMKLSARSDDETELFADRAAKVRDVGVRTDVYGQVLFVGMTMLATLATAMVYGLGGSLVIHHLFKIGTLVALVALLFRLYGPIGQLATVQVSVMTALVSFDRVFEVLDLRPLIADAPDAVSLPRAIDGRGTAPDVEFDGVWFRYPTAKDVSLASLESIALPAPERADAVADVLREISFRAPSGKLTALVGPSGAGKSTIAYLVARLYDPCEGAVRIGGYDVREVSLDSLHDVVGVVTQDTYLHHETLRANLLYARPSATEAELVEACEGAQIWDLISMLPDGLDTVVGDRGYRLSGGEKQRVSLARLLLKQPTIVVLDEATAHLDSESEAAVQRALKAALAGRTSLVIAHRLSTIREADQILVIEGGQIRERGRHAELLAAGGLYAELYYTQFAAQEDAITPNSLPRRTPAVAAELRPSAPHRALPQPAATGAAVAASHLVKIYQMGKVEVRALNDVSLEIGEGAMVCITGRSGSGKSTLLRQLGLIDLPTSGSVWLNGREVTGLPERRRSQLRLLTLGYVFQEYALLPELTAAENVCLPALMAGHPLRHCRRRALELLEVVEIGRRARHRPKELSGGELQRVAIARALVNKPGTIFADEPTANLDSVSARRVMRTLQKVNEVLGTTVVFVSHDQSDANYATQLIHLSDGTIRGTEDRGRVVSGAHP